MTIHEAFGGRDGGTTYRPSTGTPFAALRPEGLGVKPQLAAGQSFAPESDS
ncbi:hypothetical protein BC793_11964 [Actinoplanes xinjiangensis]|uniref:Uncharacterized protein n=1 Tax=Actinoplanes xinjiangensis TaxID=512350 RepID=A0A316F4B8_9ACTN|nr:hypothetical protein BC793_11964 [Actinoplanes xinjiangensis]